MKKGLNGTHRVSLRSRIAQARRSTVGGHAPISEGVEIVDATGGRRRANVIAVGEELLAGAAVFDPHDPGLGELAHVGGGRGGTFSGERDIRSYGILVSRCAIMLIRARCLSSLSTTNHGDSGISVWTSISSLARE